MKKFAESFTCRRQILLDALGGENNMGEDVVCDGCDICDGPTKVAKDLRLAYNFIRSHSGRYNRIEIESLLVDLLNRKIPLDCNLNCNCERKFATPKKLLRIWTDESVAALVEQMISYGIVTKKKFPWNVELSAKSKNELLKEGKIIPLVFRLVRPRQNFLLQEAEVL